jgi:hypothetical protein
MPIPHDYYNAVDVTVEHHIFSTKQVPSVNLIVEE